MKSSSAVVAVLVYVMCSSTMLVVNKAAMNALPFSNTVSALQTGVGAVLLYACRAGGVIEQFPTPNASKIGMWCPVVLVWIIPIALNMAAMRYLTVETLMMFRSVTIVLVAIGDYAILGNSLSRRQQMACLVISIGGVIYASNDISFNVVGYLWGVSYSFAMLVNSIYTKFAFNQNKSMSTWEKSFLNNLLATPMMMACMGLFEDMHKMRAAAGSMSAFQSVFLALSCVMGLGIRSLLTPSRGSPVPLLPFRSSPSSLLLSLLLPLPFPSPLIFSFPAALLRSTRARF